MAYSDLAKFNEQTYSFMTEVLDQQTENLRTSSGGAVVLTSGLKKGDYDETAMFGLVADLVGNRDITSTSTNSTAVLSQIIDRSVKRGAKTKTVALDPQAFRWIGTDPAVAAATIGQQLAVASFNDMINVALLSCRAALSGVAALNYDGTAGAFDAKSFVKGARKFGDMSSAIQAWIMHSSVAHDLQESAVTNTEKLFTYGTLNVIRDPQGRIILMTDSASLVTEDGVSSGIDKYYTLGLVPGAITVNQNADFDAVITEDSSKVNIQRNYLANWSHNFGVKGFAWDPSTGGPHPSDAAMGTAANWNKYATSHKDCAGVLIATR